jgi:phospholipid transport system substrate-binding protein
MMLNRRTFLILGGVAMGALRLGLPATPARAQSPQAAVGFVRQTGSALAAVVNGPGSDADRKSRLTAILYRDVDIDGIGRFCLGRFWRVASPRQQAEYLALFHDVLVTSITSHLGDYRGVSFTIGGATAGDGGISVSTVISRPGNAPANVDWIVTQVNGQWKIIDVVAEGTSLRLTQRDDYLSYLARNGNDVQALIDALRRQTSQSG